MKYVIFVATFVLVQLLSPECLQSGGLDEGKHLSKSDRLALIKRAQVWAATDVPAMDIKAGPRMKGAFAPGETVTCDYVKERLGGATPKFSCDITPDDKVKVRFGRENGEVFAGVAATRLLWALGFGTDALYPVHVICRGCPSEFAGEGEPRAGEIFFDVAAIERKMPGHELEGPGGAPGWVWPELDLVNEGAGGATVAQRDALKLLAAFLQHSDNKQEQQKFMCLDAKLEHSGATCERPFMMIHDLGLTFGRSNLFNRANLGGVNFKRWADTPIWKDAKHCVANLAASQTGTLAHPVISERGRAMLADLLGQLTDRQLQDLFEVARFDKRFLPNGVGAAPIAVWVDAFKHKRNEIATNACGTIIG